MAEPFKNLFNIDVINNMASHLARVDTQFDAEGFVHMAFTGLEALDLKARSNHICDALTAHLPNRFAQAAKLIVASLHPDSVAPLGELRLSNQGIRGWGVMPLAEYVARNGLQDFALGMHVLRELTSRFTAEFAIRAFILYDQKRAVTLLKEFSQDSNFHVRRLASEGSRPRLPWGQQLPALIDNPAPILPILDRLKNDPHEYVRKSVANHLNDICKDHPNTVIDFVTLSLPAADANLKRLFKHGCRTLIKNGDKKTLEVFGFKAAKVHVDSAALNFKSIKVGDSIQLTLSLRSTAKNKQAILLDYIVYYKKSNGEQKPKVFKWKTFTLPAEELMTLQKTHSFKKVTTRTLYPGVHAIAVQINGTEYIRLPFTLKN